MSESASPRIEPGRAGPRPSILVVEDDAELAEQLRWGLRGDQTVRVARDAARALAAVRRRPPDLLLLDLCLPPSQTSEEGFRVLRQVRATHPDVPVVVMSGLEGRDAAIQAVGEGAYDFFAKPFDLDTLRIVVKRAFERRALERENRRLREQLHGTLPIEGLACASPAMQRVADLVRRVADSCVTVFLEGESGVGKEVVARAIHAAGGRRDRSFVAVHCAALPETLLESELFGHEKGAFTGATAARPGRFEAAHTGTLFLDEVGTLPPATQVKLLRSVETRTVERLGARAPREVDFRLIVATNENLEEKVQRGEFREDLFFRIHVLPIRVPPLRERAEDIPLLAELFLKQAGDGLGVPPKRLTHAARLALAQRAWPGNARQLRNLMQSLALLVDGDTIDVGDLPEAIPLANGATLLERARAVGLKQALEDCEKELLQEAIRSAQGSKARAARELGIQPSQMKYLVQKYGL